MCRLCSVIFTYLPNLNKGIPFLHLWWRAFTIWCNTLLTNGSSSEILGTHPLVCQRLHPSRQKMHQAWQEGVPKDCHSHSYWFQYHGLHWILCQTYPHPNQQHHCRIINISMVPYWLLLFLPCNIFPVLSFPSTHLTWFKKQLHQFHQHGCVTTSNFVHSFVSVERIPGLVKFITMLLCCICLKFELKFPFLSRKKNPTTYPIPGIYRLYNATILSRIVTWLNSIEQEMQYGNLSCGFSYRTHLWICLIHQSHFISGSL